ncbi:transcriptional regulator with GAF, ATPase, and Fis domain [Mycolicibacterium sp. BK556]|uniref:GAF and ANTAR domain-containing protein n=1 Tax=unclassified Mycolicibacterium TaxID=2636767 RepID=UPI00161B9E16|nr:MULTISPECIES: ANTAR domain-containing protein [unclassified Mycolicibacterium]MBB3604411.1 transcriptional regulator with GAF, ATPase, and Fis domain [Mycolicibacterium sp. BK556]MBB3634876.1 transcriptional regulator with GAF, ATPase, and Fis domain [Mycolicibacterium sp. BK607]
MSVDNGSPPTDGDVAARIADIARGLYARRSHRGGVIAGLVEHAVAELPGVDYANVTVLSAHNDIETPSATHEWAVRIDDIQRRHREGPCLSSAWHHQVVHVDDLQHETRWPKFRADALETTPVRSIMGFQLHLSGKPMGALNVFAERANAFGNQTRQLGSLLAAHSALVWDAAQREVQFQEALASRDIIGQAKGMIMERYTMNADRAFEMLRQLSHDTNVPLAAVAAKIVDAAQSNPH